MALVEHILYTVVVDVPSPHAYLASARGAGGYLFGQRLVTGLTQLHRLFAEMIYCQNLYFSNIYHMTKNQKHQIRNNVPLLCQEEPRLPQPGPARRGILFLHASGYHSNIDAYR